MGLVKVILVEHIEQGFQGSNNHSKVFSVHLELSFRLGQILRPRIHRIHKLHHRSSLVYPLNDEWEGEGEGKGGEGIVQHIFG